MLYFTVTMTSGNTSFESKLCVKTLGHKFLLRIIEVPSNAAFFQRSMVTVTPIFLNTLTSYHSLFPELSL